MTKFRGVEQENVVNSIREAASFIEQLNIGPATNALVKPLLDPAYLAAISTATTEEDIYKATIKASGAFSYLSKLLDFHAALNTGGNGYNICRDLIRWGAFGNTDMAYRPHNAEIDKHVRRKSFNPINAVRYLAHEFHSASGKHGYMKLNAESPFKHYGIVPDAKNYSHSASMTTQLDKQVETILTRHFNTGNVRSFGKGPIGDRDSKNSQWGIMFETTEAVAKEIASTFPDHQVIDERNRRIEAPKP